MSARCNHILRCSVTVCAPVSDTHAPLLCRVQGAPYRSAVLPSSCACDGACWQPVLRGWYRRKSSKGNRKGEAAAAVRTPRQGRRQRRPRGPLRRWTGAAAAQHGWPPTAAAAAAAARMAAAATAMAAPPRAAAAAGRPRVLRCRTRQWVCKVVHCWQPARRPCRRRHGRYGACSGSWPSPCLCRKATPAASLTAPQVPGTAPTLRRLTAQRATAAQHALRWLQTRRSASPGRRTLG